MHKAGCSSREPKSDMERLVSPPDSQKGEREVKGGHWGGPRKREEAKAKRE